MPYLTVKIAAIGTADAVPVERRGAMCPVSLQLARTSIQVDGRLVPLSPGMNLTAEIKTGRRPVIDCLLSPIERACVSKKP